MLKFIATNRRRIHSFSYIFLGNFYVNTNFCVRTCRAQWEKYHKYNKWKWRCSIVWSKMSIFMVKPNRWLNAMSKSALLYLVWMCKSDWLSPSWLFYNHLLSFSILFNVRFSVYSFFFIFFVVYYRIYRVLFTVAIFFVSLSFDSRTNKRIIKNWLQRLN